MKIKAVVLSVALLLGAISVGAQTKEKSSNLFLGAGVGVASPLTPGFNKPAIYANVQLGFHLTPIWSVRGAIGGWSMNLNSDLKNATIAGKAIPDRNRKFVELNIDGILSLSNLFADDFAKFDVYLFAGPTGNLSFGPGGSTFAVSQDYMGKMIVEDTSDTKLGVGATAGLGLAYNVTKKLAIGAEARFGITPSIFGDMDRYRKGEASSRLTINAVYTINGRKGKLESSIESAKAANYISPEAAQAMAQAAVSNNPKIVEKVVEKVVEKKVEKEVVKEVVKNVPAYSTFFFEIDKARLSSNDIVRVKLLADAIKADGDSCKYEIGGYADKKTGSESWNNRLSEKRAKAVYDLLVAEGVNASQLEIKAYGGVDAIFFNNDVLSRTVIVKEKK